MVSCKKNTLKYYSTPHLLHIETTYRCNANCIFCYNPNRDKSIDYNKLDLIVDSVRKSEIPHVYLIGGEPSILEVNKLNEYIDKLSEVSSVTIVTNAIKYLDGLSHKLACIGVPIHGNKETHEFLNNYPGSYEKIINSITKYVNEGFDVRCIPVLMKVNYNQMYDVIKLASELGMESVFVDRFEEGGIGSKSQIDLKPSDEEFKVSLSQMIAARNDFNMLVGFGTAIPYCLDERLLKENIYANCGVGATFCAVSPTGDLRICNQSNVIYGNVLTQTIENIWNSSKLNDFRDLSWVTEPCKSCDLLLECVCGCKVDQNCSDKYCVDYAVRNKAPNVDIHKLKIPENTDKLFTPEYYRRFTVNKYAKINLKHDEKYLVTRYQTIEIDDEVVKILKYILDGCISEEDLINQFKEYIEVESIRDIVNKLVFANAIDEVKDIK